MELSNIQKDKKELQNNLIDLINSFESKYNVTVVLGCPRRYNGSNNAGGKLIDLGLTIII